MKRKMVSVRLPPDIIELLKKSGQSQSKMIEAALRILFEVKK